MFHNWHRLLREVAVRVVEKMVSWFYKHNVVTLNIVPYLGRGWCVLHWHLFLLFLCQRREFPSRLFTPYGC